MGLKNAVAAAAAAADADADADADDAVGGNCWRCCWWSTCA